MPIWLLYSSIFMVVRCADLVSGFWFLDSGFFDVSLMFSLMFASVPYSGFFPSAGSVSQRKVASAGQGLRRGILLGLRETLKALRRARTRLRLRQQTLPQ